MWKKIESSTPLSFVFISHIAQKNGGEKIIVIHISFSYRKITKQNQDIKHHQDQVEGQGSSSAINGCFRPFDSFPSLSTDVNNWARWA